MFLFPRDLLFTHTGLTAPLEKILPRKGELRMIILKNLRGDEFAINCDLIETISENPDTTMLLTNGRVYIVKESMQEVIDKTIEYHRKIAKGDFV